MDLVILLSLFYYCRRYGNYRTKVHRYVQATDKVSEETKEKMRLAKVGKVIWTKESLEKLSQSLKGVGKGRKVTEEVKKKLRQVALARHITHHYNRCSRCKYWSIYYIQCKARAGTGVSDQTIRKYNGRQYKNRSTHQSRYFF